MTEELQLLKQVSSALYEALGRPPGMNDADLFALSAAALGPVAKALSRARRDGATLEDVERRLCCAARVTESQG